ncbi:MAG: hypothetical protein J0L66_11185 [Cytophagales bacterium]|nr:hypothetical protein [Cytophagales bacterium]
MKILLFFVFLFASQFVKAQIFKDLKPDINIRLSFLVFPFTTLLTVEGRTVGNLTLQLETDFLNTHGANLKYFMQNRMDGHYVFTGVAFMENKLLRKDKQITFLLYAGYGYAYRFGKLKHWTFDNRIGIGSTTNADKNSTYPVIKTGVGYIF